MTEYSTTYQPPEFRTVTASQIRVSNRHTVSERELDSLRSKCEVESYTDHRVKGMVIQLQTYIHAIEKERVTVYCEFPKDWWQAFKARWFPAWALRRWPAEMVVIDIDKPIYGPVCPHLFADDRQHHLQWMVMDDAAV